MISDFLLIIVFLVVSYLETKVMTLISLRLQSSECLSVYLSRCHGSFCRSPPTILNVYVPSKLTVITLNAELNNVSPRI